tara:strand:+ start:2749 stop:3084 length:336 start_codon:yes stop_codon:yes gene_type:complete
MSFKFFNDSPFINLVDRTGKVGRPRILPIDKISPSQFKEDLGKDIKDFTTEQRKVYNRLASRRTYAELKVIENQGISAQEYKDILNKSKKKRTNIQQQELNRLTNLERRYR